MPNDVIDFDLCWAYDLVDPWANLYELNCYDYEQVRADLIEADAITPVRYWPQELHLEYSRRHRSATEPQKGDIPRRADIVLPDSSNG